MTSKQLHLAIISSPGVGHLLPVLQLAHRLTTHHHHRVTVLSVITDNASPAISQLLTSFTNNINLSIIQIPAPDISSILPPDAKVITHLCLTMRKTIPAIRTTMSSMDPRPHVLIGDIFSNESWVVAEELSIPKYVFVTGNAWFTALFAYSPVLDKQVSGQYIDQKMPLNIPGCKPVSPEDVVDPMPNRDDEAYNIYYVNQAIGVTLADGVLINTWEDLEPQTLDALRNNEILRSVLKNKPVYTVGPIHQKYEPHVLKNDVVEWLDKQPEQSVVYVSFGSGGTISAEQIEELAWGLELSRQRFIWVVRAPSGKRSDGSFLRASESSKGSYAYLPEGFLARTIEVGFVVPSWGPQMEILNHRSVGGFLTHCGWNSTIESVMSGVPMIAWPLYAEQKMNATMLTEELKVAMRPKVWPTMKVVGREEVARMVTSLMAGDEGKEMKVKMKRLKEDAEKALCENGSSYISICKFVEDCWSQI